MKRSLGVLKAYALKLGVLKISSPKGNASNGSLLRLGVLVALMFVAVPLLVQSSFAQSSEHVEVGAFADYLHYSDASPARNLFGVGGRIAFDIRPSVQLEAEMAYDFRRNYTNTFSNGVTTQFVKTGFRPLQGYFGPKLQTGSGAFRVFVTGKVGFNNFSINNGSVPSGFVNSVGLTNGTTAFALYPGAGFEAFAGPIGIRAEVGDDIFFVSGAHNNLRVTFGPQVRF
jgi:hypothetical protein